MSSEQRGQCPDHQIDTNGKNKHFNVGINYKRRRPIFGVGINDSDYVTQSISGTCPFYITWRGMIQRCFSAKWLNKYPSYRDTTVCDEWLTFSNFKAWMETQDWEGKSLDKDLLGDGNLYSPETCYFISQKLNCFINGYSTRGSKGLPKGVYKSKKRFQAMCRNPFNERPYIGYYGCPTAANFAYIKKKQEYAKRFIRDEVDPIIKAALTERFSICQS